MEEDATPKRPRIVAVAVFMLYLSLGIEAIQNLVQWSYFQSTALPLTANFLVSALMALIAYMTWKGWNWARVTSVIFILVGLPVSILSAIPCDDRSMPTSLLSINLLSIADIGVQLAALVLLFQRTSSDWFKAMKKLRRTTLRYSNRFGLSPTSSATGSFAIDESGQTVFRLWPWGSWYILPDKIAEEEIRMFLKLAFSSVCMVTFVAVLLLGTYYAIIVVIVVVLFAFWKIRRLVRGLPFKEAK